MLIILVVYVGNIGIRVVIVVFCKRILGNNNKWCFVILIICFNWVLIGWVL